MFERNGSCGETDDASDLSSNCVKQVFSFGRPDSTDGFEKAGLIDFTKG